MRNKHIIQSRPVIVDELQLTRQAIRRFKNGRQGLLR